jgi:hypothetical protein
MKTKPYSIFLAFVVVLIVTGSVSAQADVETQVTDFFQTIEDVMIAIATSAAVIGFLGLALMNLGSSLPIMAEWKQENPKAARSVIMGLIILIFVGGGGLVGLLSF